LDYSEIKDADVVCLQEVAPESFLDDFAFMSDLGYDHEMFKKGRFRPATFWKASKLDLATGPVHKDRTLLTAFRLKMDFKENSVWYVLNCHLQAGKQAQRSLRQINEGCRAVINLSRKLKGK
jgi:mRNA deadenylase 3'-5' endonuclease subunit Ccr4